MNNAEFEVMQRMSEVRLIDANALKAKIKSKYDNDDAEFDRGYNIGLDAAVNLIDSAPTITPDMPTVMGKANFDYCPNCGAKMKENNNEDQKTT